MLAQRYDELRVKDDDEIWQYNCLECGGGCCFNADVLVAPYDVWRIMHNKTITKRLGIKTTNDLYHPEKGRPLLNLYIGEQSHLPVASINNMELSDDLSLCPFAAPVLVAKSKAELKKILKKDFDKSLFFRTPDGIPAIFCGIQEEKPIICKAFPLGRMGRNNVDEDKLPEMKYVKMDTERCDKFRIKNTCVTVKEFIKNKDLEKDYVMSDLVYALYDRIKRLGVSDNLRSMIGNILYDFDNLRSGRPRTFQELVQIIHYTFDTAPKRRDKEEEKDADKQGS